MKKTFKRHIKHLKYTNHICTIKQAQESLAAAMSLSGIITS